MYWAHQVLGSQWWFLNRGRNILTALPENLVYSRRGIYGVSTYTRWRDYLQGCPRFRNETLAVGMGAEMEEKGVTAHWQGENWAGKQWFFHCWHGEHHWFNSTRFYWVTALSRHCSWLGTQQEARWIRHLTSQQDSVREGGAIGTSRKFRTKRWCTDSPLPGVAFLSSPLPRKLLYILQNHLELPQQFKHLSLILSLYFSRSFEISLHRQLGFQGFKKSIYNYNRLWKVSWKLC